jgi:hypothetical protein
MVGLDPREGARGFPSAWVTTRHFDLLIACAIAWMRNFATHWHRRKPAHSESTQGQQTQDFDPYQADASRNNGREAAFGSSLFNGGTA